MALRVQLREGESLESLLRRFQRMVQREGILRDVKAHRYFISKREAVRIKSKRSNKLKRRRSKARK